MCIIAIKQKSVKYPSYQRVKTMCTNNSDGFAIVWKAKDQPVMNYRTLNEAKFLKKYKEITSTYQANDISLFIHARIKTHGTTKLENCHGWIDDNVGLAFAHNGILSIENRDDMTDSETFFRDIFVPVFEIGGWEAGERAINACIGSSKFCFMDMYGNLIHYGQYIHGDDGVLYSNDSYLERSWGRYGHGGISSYPSIWDEWDRDYGKNDKKNESKKPEQSSTSFVTSKNEDDYDVWYNTKEYWERKTASPI